MSTYPETPTDHELRRAVADPLPTAEGLTLSNWQRAPWNRRSFQRMAQLIPTERINRGVGPVLGLRSRPVNLDAVGFRTQDGSWSTLAELLLSTCTDGFIALHGGSIASELYFNGMTPRTRHLLQSVSKSLTATLAGALVQAGFLRAEGRLTEYLPELRGTSFEGATVRHLLDMTAGTQFSEDYDDPDADVRLYESAAGWLPAKEGEPDLDLLGYILTLPNRWSHGEVFAYRSILTDLLALVLERASGTSFADAMSRLVWGPLGAEDDAELTLDRRGNPMADGGFSVTLRDLARFGQLYLQGGCVDGRQVVPFEWVHDTRTADAASRRTFLASDEAAEAMCSPIERACLPQGHYRNHWWVLDPEMGVMLASGIYGQYVYVDMAANVVLVKLSSLPEPLDLRTSADTLAAFAAVATRLSQL